MILLSYPFYFRDCLFREFWVSFIFVGWWNGAGPFYHTWGTSFTFRTWTYFHFLLWYGHHQGKMAFLESRSSILDSWMFRIRYSLSHVPFKNAVNNSTHNIWRITILPYWKKSERKCLRVACILWYSTLKISLYVLERKVLGNEFYDVPLFLIKIMVLNKIKPQLNLWKSMTSVTHVCDKKCVKSVKQ